MRDRLALSDKAVVVPRPLALLLSLCDGTRDAKTLGTAFELRTGMGLPPWIVGDLLRQLDDALLLDNERFARAKQDALSEYRSAPCRPPASAGRAYSAEPAELARELEGYLDGAMPSEEVGGSDLRGLISPHIDFRRGGSVYGKIWRFASQALKNVELVIMFGTDHSGDRAALTVTRQNYATPFGVLPTAQDVVDSVVDAIGDEAAFAEELHHRHEHSLELGAVWLHYLARGQSFQVVPILCGSFQHFSEGLADPAADERLSVAVHALRTAARGRRTLVVAAADLAHVGPAFGDAVAFGPIEQAALGAADRQMLEDACAGGAEGFFERLRSERDRRRVCGLPPIYLTLRLLGNARGQVVDYAQCPADAEGHSWVSIAGVALH
ncbi:MAG: AmmeMemoRadiSam system protein B [Chloroflexi bacterium]|nr:AmmeMemoRadiSam system protein B [Chloroflexota bacterium]